MILLAKAKGVQSELHGGMCSAWLQARKILDEEVATVSQVAVNGVRAKGGEELVVHPKILAPLSCIPLHRTSGQGLCKTICQSFSQTSLRSPDDVVDPREQTEKWANVRKTFGTHCSSS